MLTIRDRLPGSEVAELRYLESGDVQIINRDGNAYTINAQRLADGMVADRLHDIPPYLLLRAVALAAAVGKYPWPLTSGVGAGSK